jgi:hypothetical protein
VAGDTGGSRRPGRPVFEDRALVEKARRRALIAARKRSVEGVDNLRGRVASADSAAGFAACGAAVSAETKPGELRRRGRSGRGGFWVVSGAPTLISVTPHVLRAEAARSENSTS